MVVNLSGVQNQEPREYIRQEGHYTLKCIDIKQSKISQAGNPVFKITFVSKDNLYFIDEITITDAAKWKIKQLADAFGFTYDNVNILNFKDMYLVAWLVGRKVKNKHEQLVDIVECKQYTKSAKLENKIPPEGTNLQRQEPPVVYENNIPEINIEDEEIPF